MSSRYGMRASTVIVRSVIRLVIRSRLVFRHAMRGGGEAFRFRFAGGMITF